MINKLKLMEMQVKTLYTHDNKNFIRNINDLDGKSAPRFFYGRTLEGNVVRFRYDLPQDIMKNLTELIDGETISCNLPKTTVLLEKIKEILQGHGKIQEIDEGPAYIVPKGIKFPRDVVRITKENVHILKDSFKYMLSELEYWEPCFVKFVDGKVASICFSSRIANTSHEAGLETMPDFRGRGYALEVVAAWADAIYEMKRIPIYSTSWNNTSSQSVAKKLGCELYGVDLSIY